MRYTLFFLFFFYSFQIFAQSAEKWEYCSIWHQTGGFGSKTTVNVDFGDKSLGSFGKAQVLKDSTASDSFKSQMDALNFLGSSGWECISVFESKNDLAPMRYYFFKRRKK